MYIRPNACRELDRSILPLNQTAHFSSPQRSAHTTTAAMARWLICVALCSASAAQASPIARSSSGSPDDVDSTATRIGASSHAGADSGCCGPAGLVCDGPHFTGVVEETLYFAHPRNMEGAFDWGDHDMADNLGEAVCLLVINQHFFNRKSGFFNGKSGFFNRKQHKNSIKQYKTAHAIPPPALLLRDTYVRCLPTGAWSLTLSLLLSTSLARPSLS